jgi:acetylornithine deacetylase
MPFPTLKTGPGDSARSHTADEFIFVEEIGQGIRGYIDLLTPVLAPPPTVRKAKEYID